MVFVGSVGLYHFRAGDAAGRYLAAVGLVRHRGLKVAVVARALGVDRGTIHRRLKRYDKTGTDGLILGKGKRRPTKIVGAVEQRLLELAKQGAGPREIVRRLGLSLGGVTGALVRLGVTKPDSHPQPCLPEPPPDSCETGSPESVNPEAALRSEPSSSPLTEPSPVEEMSECNSERAPVPESQDQESVTTELATVALPTAASVDVDPLNRSGDRLMAQLGLLDDATPMFAPGIVPKGGVLLAVPMLIDSGIFDIAETVYGGIGPAFYGLRTSFMAFLLMALLRIKRTEHLKEVSPAALGRILGLDRALEMKTLRGNLHQLAERKKSLEFMRLLAKSRADEYANDLAYLYVDGHVRVYSGQEDLPKAYVMQRRRAMPGTVDYWVNDKKGQPLLVITAEANEGLSKMLSPCSMRSGKRLAISGRQWSSIVVDGTRTCSAP